MCASPNRGRCSGQLLGFESEKHGGALDALVYRILGPVGEGIAPKEIGYA